LQKGNVAKLDHADIMAVPSSPLGEATSRPRPPLSEGEGSGEGRANAVDQREENRSRARLLMPGTCGELVQGRIDGVPFHVSCPIDLFSEVEVGLVGPGEPWYFPADAPKAASAVKAALAYLGLSRVGGRLSIRSSLPRGKGMASSTADVAGSIFAVFEAAGRTPESDEVANLALSVEPTDGSILPGIAIFDHRTGLVREALGDPPPIEIVVLDFGGEVDTLEFNSRSLDEELCRLQPEFARALELARKGLSEGDAALIGRAATVSAVANQSILPKPRLSQVIAFANRISALGVNVGHSGTVIGVLLDPSRHDVLAVETSLRREFPDLLASWRCKMIGGGFRLRSQVPL